MQTHAYCSIDGIHRKHFYDIYIYNRAYHFYWLQFSKNNDFLCETLRHKHNVKLLQYNFPNVAKSNAIWVEKIIETILKLISIRERTTHLFIFDLTISHIRTNVLSSCGDNFRIFCINFDTSVFLHLDAVQFIAYVQFCNPQNTIENSCCVLNDSLQHENGER